MESLPQKQNKLRRSRDSLDRKFDQWIETGRQFVDGVAGTRPGKRKPLNTSRLSTASFDKVGRWVGDKIDWLLEDEDDWVEPWEPEPHMNSSGNKRPLDAISRRTSRPNRSSLAESESEYFEDQWPSDDSYRLDRWQRSEIEEGIESGISSKTPREVMRSERRPLPRSSRRRDY